METALADGDGHASVNLLRIGWYVPSVKRIGSIQEVCCGSPAAPSEFYDATTGSDRTRRWLLLTQRPPHLLPPGYTDWDTCLQPARNASPNLQSQPGGIAARTCGEQNTLQFSIP